MVKPSDPRFAAIELTAEQTDILTDLFIDLQQKLAHVVTLSEETKRNVIVLKAQQDEIVYEQSQQAIKLAVIEKNLQSVDQKIDAIQTSVDEIHRAVAGATSLAKSALDEANKTRLKKVAINR